MLHPFAGTDLWRVFEARTALSRDEPFLTWQPFDAPPSTWTYAETLAEARSLAAALQARGIAPGDRVLVHLDNSPEFLFAWLGCAAAGAVAVTTNTRSAEDELAYYARDSGVVASITQPRYAGVVGRAAPWLGWHEVTRYDGTSERPTARQAGAGFTSLRADPAAYVERAPDPAAPLSVQYTSGTTSRPKGVVWTHANALWSARACASHEDLRRTDRHLVYLPLFHSNAISFSVLPTIWVGGRIILTPKWSTSRFWDISTQHGCTWLSLIGLSIRALLGTPAPAGHTYRMFGTGVSLEEFPGVGVKTLGWYGMTETIAPVAVADAHLPNRPGGIGRPSPSYGVKVVREDGSPVELEETGQILVKGVPGVSLFAEYLGRSDETAAAFDVDGWFRTGDLVTVHADGHLSFADRAKDMLRVGAENVAASEIERTIGLVPGVVEVAVVGRPDDKLDEVPVAFVRTTEADESLAERVTKQCASLLADFKVPRAVYPVAELPRSLLAKVDKKALRAVAAPEADRAAAVSRWLADAALDPSGEAAP